MHNGEKRITDGFIPDDARTLSEHARAPANDNGVEHAPDNDAQPTPLAGRGRSLTPQRGDSGARARYVGPYRLVALIGEGAMGRVFRAEHATLGRHVAVKMLRPELARDLGCMQRFFAEARAVNLIHSEHLVEVTDLCRDPGGDTYLVMELLEGLDLYDLAASTQLSLQRSLRMMCQLCETLAEVHRAGVVHRDLKPENVFVTQRNGEDFIKLLDFGIAKHVDVAARSVSKTAPGILLGTPQYMAPEQAAAGDVDHRTDIYALGVVLFQLMTERLPFQNNDMNTLLHDIAFSKPPTLGQFVALPASIREAMDALVARCLRKSPSSRPQSVLEVAAALHDMLEALQAQGEGEVEPILHPRPVYRQDLSLPRSSFASRATEPQIARVAGPIAQKSRRRKGAMAVVWVAAGVMGLTLAWQLAVEMQWARDSQAALQWPNVSRWLEAAQELTTPVSSSGDEAFEMTVEPQPTTAGTPILPSEDHARSTLVETAARAPARDTAERPAPQPASRAKRATSRGRSARDEPRRGTAQADRPRSSAAPARTRDALEEPRN